MNRNTRLSRLMALNAPEVIIFTERRMVFEAVRELLVGPADLALVNEGPTETSQPLAAMFDHGAADALQLPDLASPRTRAGAKATAVLFAMGFEVRGLT